MPQKESVAPKFFNQRTTRTVDSSRLGNVRDGRNDRASGRSGKTVCHDRSSARESGSLSRVAPSPRTLEQAFLQSVFRMKHERKLAISCDPIRPRFLLGKTPERQKRVSLTAHIRLESHRYTEGSHAACFAAASPSRDRTRDRLMLGPYQIYELRRPTVRTNGDRG